MIGQGAANSLDDGDRAFRLGEPVTASGFAGDLLDGAGEIDVECGEAAGRRHGGTKARRREVGGGVGIRILVTSCLRAFVRSCLSLLCLFDQSAVRLRAPCALLDHHDGAGGHLGGVGAHDLTGEGVVVDRRRGRCAR